MNLVEPKDIAAAIAPSLERFQNTLSDTITFALQHAVDRLNGLEVTISPITIKVKVPEQS